MGSGIWTLIRPSDSARDSATRQRDLCGRMHALVELPERVALDRRVRCIVRRAHIVADADHDVRVRTLGACDGAHDARSDRAEWRARA